MQVYFVFDNWVDGNLKSMNNTEKGVELSAGMLHGGSTFLGEIYLPHTEEEAMRQALAEGYHPSFTIHGEAIAQYQVQNIKQLITRLRDPNTLIPAEMKKELETGNASVLADVLERALEVK